MKRIIVILLLIPATTLVLSSCSDAANSTDGNSQEVKAVDICIYGGNSAGVIAAYTAKMKGKSVLLVEPGKRLGGLTSGGLGFTDIGNKFAVSRLALDFYRRVGAHYGKFESWIFEPKVADSLFRDYVKRADVEVWFESAVIDLKKNDGKIEEISVRDPLNEDGTVRRVRAKMYLDCSYEGDLMAAAGVNYTVGREGNDLYGETYNGVQLRQYHQFPDGIDPYKIPGDASSGLVWGVSAEPLQPTGSGDKKVQAYNYRICLTKDEDNRLPIEKPADYDSSRYELLMRYLAKAPTKDLRPILKWDLMPNNKTDINNNGPFSTDMIGENYDYPEASYAVRNQIADRHKSYILGLLYFIGNDRRMPEHLRKQMLEWGLPKDEYLESDHWTPQMYVRESRRMIGEYVMTQHNCEGREKVEDGIAMAAYTMDSHNCQRVVVNGMVKNEGDVQVGGFGPYPISYRSIVPKKSEAENLLVPVCLSASHIAYGSIRMEPVFMVLGQSAAVAAIMAIDAKKPVQEIDVKKLQEYLAADPLADGSAAEQFVDNASESVIVKGNWKKEEHLGYGPDLLIAKDADASVELQFNPSITQEGNYAIYAYVLPRYPEQVKTVDFYILDGNKEQLLSLDLNTVEVSGQTSGTWVKLGEYKLQQGAVVSIRGNGEKGLLLGDAILFQPKF